MQLISDSFYGGIKNITHSNAMQKTSENVKYFGQSYLVEGTYHFFLARRYISARSIARLSNFITTELDLKWSL